MTKNMSLTDRRVRGVAALVLLALSLALGIGSVGGIIAIALAVVLAVTATVRVCPLYLPFHITTVRGPDTAHHAGV